MQKADLQKGFRQTNERVVINQVSFSVFSCQIIQQGCIGIDVSVVERKEPRYNVSMSKSSSGRNVIATITPHVGCDRSGMPRAWPWLMIQANTNSR